MIHPWDAATDDHEWRSWLSTRDFGQLVAAGRDRDFPVVVPTHFLFDGSSSVVLHLARPNPVWAALQENPRALLTVIGEYTYIPAEWNTATTVAEGVPTSYYASVQLECSARVISSDEEKAEVLRRQLAHFEPADGRSAVSASDRLLRGILGLELAITGVRAKFKFGGNRPPEQRESIAGLLAERDGPLDAGARGELLRRSGAVSQADGDGQHGRACPRQPADHA